MHEGFDISFDDPDMKPAQMLLTLELELECVYFHRK